MQSFLSWLTGQVQPQTPRLALRTPAWRGAVRQSLKIRWALALKRLCTKPDLDACKMCSLYAQIRPRYLLARSPNWIGVRFLARQE